MSELEDGGPRGVRDSTLRGGWLWAARAAWVTATTLSVGLLAAGFAVALDRPDLVPSPSGRAVLTAAGVPPLVSNIGLLAILAVSVGTGLLVFVRRSNDRSTILVSLMLITGTALPVGTEWAPDIVLRWLELPIRFAYVLVYFFGLTVLFLFPDLRFVPRWTRSVAVAAVPVAVALSDKFPLLVLQQPDLTPESAKAQIGIWLSVSWVFVGLGLYSQVYRYRRVSTPAQRLQTKLVALLIVLAIGASLLTFLTPMLFIDTSSPWFLWVGVIPLAGFILAPLTIGVAIQRHHFLDIDRLITRTLSYGMLTVLIVAVYASTVVLLGRMLDFPGGDSGLAVAASTLLVAALVQPLRRRIQDAVDRRFDRRRYDAAKTIQTFNIRLREQIDLDSLSFELLRVVDQTMQPAEVRLWLRPPKGPNSSASVPSA